VTATVRAFGRVLPDVDIGPLVGNPEVEFTFRPVAIMSVDTYAEMVRAGHLPFKVTGATATLAAIAEGQLRRAVLGRCKVPRKLKKWLKKNGQWERPTFAAIHHDACETALAQASTDWWLAVMGEPGELAAAVAGVRATHERRPE
jgi:hypothetical protein